MAATTESLAGGIVDTKGELAGELERLIAKFELPDKELRSALEGVLRNKGMAHFLSDKEPVLRALFSDPDSIMAVVRAWLGKHWQPEWNENAGTVLPQLLTSFIHDAIRAEERIFSGSDVITVNEIGTVSLSFKDYPSSRKRTSDDVVRWQGNQIARTLRAVHDVGLIAEPALIIDGESISPTEFMTNYIRFLEAENRKKAGELDRYTNRDASIPVLKAIAANEAFALSGDRNVRMAYSRILKADNDAKQKKLDEINPPKPRRDR